MPTYYELANEPGAGGVAWRAQYTPPNMVNLFLNPLRNLYGLGPLAIGAAGDNFHLYGRHRSKNWALASGFCTNKFYGTTDARDRVGSGDIYRAADIGISGPPLWAACRRLDADVRAGKLPGVAEWFGTFDGRTVVGWFEGHASSSDDSHLSHGHIGWWNGSADDPATLSATYATWTGSSPAPALEEDPDMWMTTAPSKTVYLMPGDMIAGKPVAIPMTDINRVNSLAANGVRWGVSTIEPAAAYWFVTAINAPWPPEEPPVEVVLSDEQLAQIGATTAAAAQAGAEAGAPTQAELEAAAFAGAQKAEDE